MGENNVIYVFYIMARSSDQTTGNSGHAIVTQRKPGPSGSWAQIIEARVRDVAAGSAVCYYFLSALCTLQEVDAFHRFQKWIPVELRR